MEAIQLRSGAMASIKFLHLSSLAAGVIFLIPCVAQQPNSATPAKTVPCGQPEQKQFDFWVGAWDLTWPGDKAGEIARGTNSVKRVLDGCVVEENFNGGTAMHLRGISVSLFDTRSGKWKQTWVDNEGGYLDFIGEFKDGQMVLQREATRPDGTKALQRMVYKNITPNDFDWSWERSLDGGKTWQVLWPIHYKRKL